METPWFLDLLRSTLLSGAEQPTAVSWATALVDALREHKPDHEIYVFGVNRMPKLPNFLLASSEEALRKHLPLQVAVTPKTADVFLAPCASGVRLLQEELPMDVAYTEPGTQKKAQISFYEALCIDSERLSLVLGLTSDMSDLRDFFPPEEIRELMSLVRSQGFPLLDLLTCRVVLERKEEEALGLLSLVRSGGGISAEVMAKLGLEAVPLDRPTAAVEGGFLTYVVQEFKQPLAQIGSANDKVLDAAVGHPTLAEAGAMIQDALNSQQQMLRNLSNLASLSMPEVKPREGSFSLRAFVPDLQKMAQAMADRAGVKLRVEEGATDCQIGADRETVMKMIERLLEATLPHCRGAGIFIRTENDPEVVGKNRAVIELEDTGVCPADIPPEQLLTRSLLGSLPHPRLKRGAGILFQNLALFLEKYGGEFRLIRGPREGFCAQLVLPLSSKHS